jgi:hypothetical protein
MGKIWLLTLGNKGQRSDGGTFLNEIEPIPDVPPADGYVLDVAEAAFDRIHPSNTGYALTANQYVAAINASLKTNIPAVDVTATAAVDPLFGPNIKPVGAAVSIRWRLPAVPINSSRRARHRTNYMG